MSAIKYALPILLLVAGGCATAASKSELEDRIVQLERKLDSRSLMDLMEQVRVLQREVQQLRGDIELQTHNMEGLQKRQRDLYMDIDRRLQRMEGGGMPMQQGGGMPMQQGSGMSMQQGSGSAPPSPAFQGGGGSRYGSVPDAALGGGAAPAMSGDGGAGGYAPSLPDSGSVGAYPSAAGAGAAASAAAAAPSSQQASLNPAEERKAYDSALEVLKEGRYSDAATAFRDFLSQYPNSSYADNAQYWRGEVYYVTREFESALTEFEKVASQYPDSAKVPDAKLKMGYIRYELKDWGEARKLLKDVVQQYPGSTSARLAQERLDRMNSESR
jgi:tol-pal system protein YbgF